MSNKGSITRKCGQEHRTVFIKLFKQFEYKYSNWQVWQDFIYLSAVALSQPCDYRQEREKKYLNIINSYPKELQNLFPQMLNEIVEAFEQERFADILGDMYMELELYNKWRGQFFTPYNICSMLAQITGSLDSIVEEIKQKGYISVNDPACGAGALLIAFAENCTKQKINYQTDVLFVAQDVDTIVAQMCYIQMSLLGMPGYVIIGNTLTNNFENYDYWYTPMYFRDIWNWRRFCHKTINVINSL